MITLSRENDYKSLLGPGLYRLGKKTVETLERGKEELVNEKYFQLFFNKI